MTEVKKLSWWENPVLRQVILGTHDDGSPLSQLRGCNHLLSMIFSRLLQAWRTHIDDTKPGFARLEWGRETQYGWDPDDVPGVRIVDFPPPETVDNEPVPFHVNMMPFVMGDIESLPPSCRRYQPLILDSLYCIQSDEMGKIGYLTIHEGWVEPNTSQRRPGLHVEAAGGQGTHNRVLEMHWGGGSMIEQVLHGGILMASTVAHSCGIWNVVVENPRGVTGPLGDVSMLRSVLDPDIHGYVEPEANELFWITDATPHESLPVKERCFRQYFRLVTSQVSHWFANHSTANPLGIQPAADIIHGDKFGSTVQFDTAAAPLSRLSNE
ncbi:hypothetical protein LEN26_019081 [Aphanomyces euteiches]|nr:hypothetical protein LEN26_019081 [Aphanomyces euteiches]KAH9106398.1 hypothetical protein AeMF1_017980 [Aphanomyces euteiches]